MGNADDRVTPYDLPDQAPETWHPAARMAKGLIGPIERFLHVQAASAIVLVITTVIALAWANSPWSESYEHLWHTKIIFSIGGFESARSLHFWINDGLMVIFFFVVGLEIRREIHEGELSDLKRASLPIAAAVGGMLVPAGIYLAINGGTEVQRGWGVPMATDIAFAVGVLTLLGKRVPAALRVLLLALAIIDDIGAILVIALFYSNSFAPTALVIAAGGIALVILMQRIGIRSPPAYVIPGVIIWFGALEAGIHPTIAGVVIGMLTPVKSWYGVKGFVSFARRAVESFQQRSARHDADPHSLVEPLEDLARARREALPPVVRLQQLLHTYVAYLIMPIFALANAGVSLGGVSMSQPGAFGVLLGISTGLIAGKIFGVFLASFFAVKLGLSTLPRGVTWKGIIVVGSVAGIGFTMAIFIAGLAFDDAAILGVSKLAVLIASAGAAAVGLVLGRAILPHEQPADIAATTASQAESSTAY